MQIKYFLMMLFICSISILAQNKLNVTVNNRPPVVKIDSTVLLAERNASIEKYNELQTKINLLEKDIANNKQAFFDSIANWYSFVLICLSLTIALLGIFGYRSINRRFDDYKREMRDIIENLKERIAKDIEVKINYELQRLDNNRKSFYDKTIDDLTRKYYELSSLLETLKIVYFANTGKPLVPTALSNEEESLGKPEGNAFEEDENE